MTIALDYDQTYTADSELWDAFVALAKSRGHRVIVVTCRRDTEENVADVNVPGCAVVFTRLASKQKVCAERGIKVDVWIEDDVNCILYGK